MDTSKPTASISRLEDLFGPTRLPIPLQPLEDELFSSWFVRVARANGLRCNHLARILTGRGRQLFIGDIDRGVWKTPVYRLADLVNASYKAAEKTLLSSYIPYLWPQLNNKGVWPFVLPISSQNHQSRKYGLQFCPQCLATDSIPYFRKQWRLSFNVVCDIHGVRLKDKCPHCAGPISVERADLKNGKYQEIPSLVQCATCQQSILVNDDSTPVDDNFLFHQRLILNTLVRGWINVNGRVIYSHLFFHGLRMLLSFLDDSRYSNKLQTKLSSLRIAQLERKTPMSRRSGGIERCDIQRRLELMQAAAWMLDQWPDKCFCVLRDMNFNSSSIFSFSKYCQIPTPFWLWEPVWDNLNKTMYVPSHIEMHNAASYLFAQSKQPTIREFCYFLNLRTNNSARVAAVWHKYHKHGRNPSH